MLHPALTRALATARIEDLHRDAAQRHTIRDAEQAPRVALRSNAIARSVLTRLRGRRAPQADGMAPTEISPAAIVSGDEY